MRVNNTHGFTLVEVIFGIVLMAIVLTIVTGLLIPQARQSADPVIQIKANELGQAMMNEILARSFDENSERSPPFRRCDEADYLACTDEADFGSEGETRADFDDVDDFIGQYEANELENSLGQAIVNNYPGFSLSITVIYDGDLDGNADVNSNAKLITVAVNAPNNDVYRFSAYKGNY